MASIRIESGFGARGRKPMVRLTIDGADIQFTPKEALRISDQLRGAAFASLADAAVIEMLGGEKLTTEEAGDALVSLRMHRGVIDRREGTEQ